MHTPTAERCGSLPMLVEIALLATQFGGTKIVAAQCTWRHPRFVKYGLAQRLSAAATAGIEPTGSATQAAREPATVRPLSLGVPTN